jgi:hypothetical protein
MQSKESRREAIRNFKEQKPLAGAYAVRCTVTGQLWAGVSRNLDATKNGCWFMLRSGSHQEKSLQAEWNAKGEHAFAYEVLEATDEEVHPLHVAALLKVKKSTWVLNWAHSRFFDQAQKMSRFSATAE